MAQVQVKLSLNAARFDTEIVDGSTTVRQYAQSKGAPMASNYSVNGSTLGDVGLDYTFDQVYAAGLATPGTPIHIAETVKTTGACNR